MTWIEKSFKTERKALRDKYYEIYRAEFDLISQRLGFFATSQAFLIGAYFTLYSSAQCDPVSDIHFSCHRNIKILVGAGLTLSSLYLVATLPPWCATWLSSRRLSARVKKLNGVYHRKQDSAPGIALHPHWKQCPTVIAYLCYGMSFVPILTPVVFFVIWIVLYKNFK